MLDKRTQLVHLGRTPHRYGGAVNTPVIRSSTLLLEDYESLKTLGEGQQWRRSYGRFGTATRQGLEQCIASLDEQESAFLLPSGLAAIGFALTSLLSPGDHILVTDSAYAPVRSLCEQELQTKGIEVTYYDPTLAESIADVLRPNTRVIYVESPGSLTFEVQDIPAIARVAHAHGAIVVADNTWATPLAPSPTHLGVDVIIHALTKYACGHSDVLMGAVTASGELAQQLDKRYIALGYTVSPDDCYLISRGLRTLSVRLREQERTALELAHWCAARPEVLDVLHPALPHHPQHALWKRDIGMSCGLFAIIIQHPTEDSLASMLNNMQFFGMGFSWGGYESLMIPLHPARYRSATHWPDDGLLLRIHAGLEAPADLIDDLQSGLSRLHFR